MKIPAQWQGKTHLLCGILLLIPLLQFKLQLEENNNHTHSLLMELQFTNTCLELPHINRVKPETNNINKPSYNLTKHKCNR
jgi:hypothetical protein